MIIITADQGQAVKQAIRIGKPSPRLHEFNTLQPVRHCLSPDPLCLGDAASMGQPGHARAERLGLQTATRTSVRWWEIGCCLASVGLAPIKGLDATFLLGLPGLASGLTALGIFSVILHEIVEGRDSKRAGGHAWPTGSSMCGAQVGLWNARLSGSRQL